MPEEKKVEHYRNGKMTRDGMVRVIEGGGSVAHEGQLFTKVSDLPDEATLAEGDAEAQEAARRAIDEDQARLDARRAAIERSASRSTPAEPPKATRRRARHGVDAPSTPAEDETDAGPAEGETNPLDAPSNAPFYGVPGAGEKK